VKSWEEIYDDAIALGMDEDDAEAYADTRLHLYELRERERVQHEVNFDGMEDSEY